MSCEQLLEVINQYIDEEIDPALCEKLKAHMAECKPCRVMVDSIRKTITLYKDDREFELPAEMRDRLHKALREHWKIRPGASTAPADPSSPPPTSSES